MKSYRFPLFEYYGPAFCFVLGIVIFIVNSFNNIGGIIILIYSILLSISMFFTEVRMDSEGISMKDLLGEKRMKWSQIARVTNKRVKGNRIQYIVLEGMDKKIKINVSIKSIYEVIEEVEKHNINTYDIPSRKEIESLQFKNKIIITIAVLALLGGILYYVK